MKRRCFGFGATTVALALFASGCSGGGTADGGDGGWNDSGPDCYPTDAGYCGVCHPMTACGEYPAGPYGMDVGMVLPPCFTAQGTWNPTGIWLFDGGNVKFASNEPLFQDLYCSSQGQPPMTYGLLQVVITDRLGNSMATDLSQCIDGPNEDWLSQGGQVMQIIEQGAMGLAPSLADLQTWVQNNGTNYSIGADTDQVLNALVHPGPMGLPVTLIVNLQTMKVMGTRSYGADFGAIQVDFTNVLDAGTF